MPGQLLDLLSDDAVRPEGLVGEDRLGEGEVALFASRSHDLGDHRLEVGLHALRQDVLPVELHVHHALTHTGLACAVRFRQTRGQFVDDLVGGGFVPLDEEVGVEGDLRRPPGVVGWCCGLRCTSRWGLLSAKREEPFLARGLAHRGLGSLDDASLARDAGHVLDFHAIAPDVATVGAVDLHDQATQRLHGLVVGLFVPLARALVQAGDGRVEVERDLHFAVHDSPFVPTRAISIAPAHNMLLHSF